MKWTLLKAATEFGSSRETIRRGLIQSGTKVRPNAKYTTIQIFKSLAGDLKAERIRETRARADLLERERAEKDRVLVNLSEVQTMIREAHLPVRQRLLALPSEMAARTNPTDPTFAREALQRWVDDALPLIRSHQPQPVSDKLKNADRSS